MARKDPPNMNMMGNKEKKATEAGDIVKEGTGANVKAPDQTWTDKNKPQAKDNRSFSERVKDSISRSEKDKEKDKDDPNKNK